MTRALTSQPASTAFRTGILTRIVTWLVVAYAFYAATQLGFSWERFISGLGNGGTFLGRMFPPDFSKTDFLWDGISETLQIAVLASLIGILLSLPIGLMGARNLMPAWVSWPARGLVSVCRSLHPVIVAILFVKAVGFGALATVLVAIFAIVIVTEIVVTQIRKKVL